MKVVVGSRNAAKRAQIIDILKAHRFELVMAEDTGVSDPEETGETFLDNALIKARAYCAGTELMTIADDSGLVIPALEGRPGIYSARFAAEHGGYDAAFLELEKQLAGKDPKAFITSTVVLMNAEGAYISSVGETWGDLVFPARPGQGFGYYPIFRPEGLQHTVSQMTPKEFEEISHRRQSMQALLTQLPAFLASSPQA